MRFGLQIDMYAAGPAGNERDRMLTAARLAFAAYGWSFPSLAERME